MLVNWFGFEGAASEGALPPSVRYAYYIGSACLLLSVFWTALSTREQAATGAPVTAQEYRTQVPHSVRPWP